MSTPRTLNLEVLGRNLRSYEGKGLYSWSFGVLVQSGDQNPDLLLPLLRDPQPIAVKTVKVVHL